MIVQKLQKKNVKLYKEIPRPFLILFAPKTLNRCLENIDNFAVDTYVKFKVIWAIKKIKDKKEEVINAADMELFDNHPKNMKNNMVLEFLLIQNLHQLSFRNLMTPHLYLYLIKFMIQNQKM